MTKIEWTKGQDGTPGKSWNPCTGCSPISEGCKNCYARRMAHRLAGRYGYPEAPHEFDVTLHPERLEEPLYWHKPQRVFTVSMGDLFHEDVSLNFIGRVMNVCSWVGYRKHTFIMLTKRPKRMAEFFAWWGKEPTFNIWLGVTCENQQRADERIPVLLSIPAAVHWLSLEPLLGPVVLPADFLALGKRAWVVAGGETGPGARSAQHDWFRSVRDQCAAAGGVPFFYKGAGTATVNKRHFTYRLIGGRTWEEWPNG